MTKKQKDIAARIIAGTLRDMQKYQDAGNDEMYQREANFYHRYLLKLDAALKAIWDLTAGDYQKEVEKPRREIMQQAAELYASGAF